MDISFHSSGERRAGECDTVGAECRPNENEHTQDLQFDTYDQSTSGSRQPDS